MEAKIWDRICGKLQQLLPPHIFHSLVESTDCLEQDAQNLTLRFQDRFSKESFEQKCLPTLQEILKGGDLASLHVSLAIAPTQETDPRYRQEIEVSRKNPFDSKYTFETFVIGSSNQFAHAACQAVSRQPGQCYNPLFIFGGAGLGKTHLLRAIGYEIFQNQRRSQDPVSHQ